MGIIDSLSKAINSTYEDQTKKIIKPDQFGDHTLIVPGITEDNQELEGSLAAGSVIWVPENTLALIFNNGTIEELINVPGEYTYDYGVSSVLNGNGIKESIFGNISKRLSFGGKPVDSTRIAYVNTRVIQNIRFGTYEPFMFHDAKYDVDVEVTCHGSLSMQIVDPILFITDFVPPMVYRCSADDKNIKPMIVSVIIKRIKSLVTSLSGKVSVSELSSNAKRIEQEILRTDSELFDMDQKYGYIISDLNIESFDYSEESKYMIRQLNNTKLIRDIKRNDASQKINNTRRVLSSYEDEFETVRKLKKLADDGIITEEEFERKKKEILGL